MNDTVPTICENCFRPQSATGVAPQVQAEEASFATQTQWISFCRCHRPYSPTSHFSIEVCGNCKRRVAAHATKRVVRLDLCSCEQPNLQKIASQLKANESDAVRLDLASVGMPPERFPSEKFSPIAFLGDSPRAMVILCRDKQRGSRVAVKLFKGINPALYATFESEVQKNKQLSHSNIARIVHSGIHNGKTPYLVTDYKEGFNLEQCLSLYGTPSYDVTVNILLGACEALNYARQQGVLHRDIRPGNIIFLDDLNSQPSICLSDFAFPKIKASEELQDAWYVLFMTGDEARGLEYSEKSEIYALGCIGYDLLTGRPPFIDGTALDIKNMHALKLPPRISSIKFDSNRPGDLNEVIEKCLEKDGRDRFASLAALQERLEVFPRRVQMRIAEALAAKKRVKLIKIAGAGLFIAALCASAFCAFVHH